MKPLLFTVSLFLFLAPKLSYSQGGNVGNGGLGAICQNQLLILDYIEAKKLGPVLQLKDYSREKFFSLILNRLNVKRQFKDQLQERLSAIKDYSSWEEIEGEFTGDVAINIYDAELVQGTDCKGIIQVAIQKAGQPKRVLLDDLVLGSEQQWVLELHEALYSIGLEKYGHQDPILTRYLIAELLRSESDPKKIKNSLNDFQNYQRNRASFQAKFFSGRVLGSYRFRDGRFNRDDLTSDQKKVIAQNINAICPSVFAFEYVRGTEIYGVADYGALGDTLFTQGFHFSTQLETGYQDGNYRSFLKWLEQSDPQNPRRELLVDSSLSNQPGIFYFQQTFKSDFETFTDYSINFRGLLPLPIFSNSAFPLNLLSFENLQSYARTADVKLKPPVLCEYSWAGESQTWMRLLSQLFYVEHKIGKRKH